MVIGSAAFLVWAMSVRIRAQERGLWFFEWVEWVVKVGGLVAVAGPVGAGVALVWERDEMWFEREFFKEKEGRRVKEKWAE